MKWALLFDFELSIPSNLLLFSFSLNFQQLLLPFNFHEDSSNTVYSAKKEMGSTDESYPLTGYEPNDYYLMETSVESPTESLTQHELPEQRFLEDGTENMSTTPSEKACLLVSRRRLCPKERGDPLLREQGDLLWKEVSS